MFGIGVLVTDRVDLIFTEFESRTGWIGRLVFQMNLTLVGICIHLILEYRVVPQIMGLET
jgi:hypothetical protein